VEGCERGRAYRSARIQMYRTVISTKSFAPAKGCSSCVQAPRKTRSPGSALIGPAGRPNFTRRCWAEATMDELLELDDISVCTASKSGRIRPIRCSHPLCKGILYRRISRPSICRASSGSRHRDGDGRPENAIKRRGWGVLSMRCLGRDQPTSPTDLCSDASNAASEMLCCDFDGKVTEFASISNESPRR